MRGYGISHVLIKLKKNSEILLERSKVSCNYCNRSMTTRVKTKKRRGTFAWEVQTPQPLQHGAEGPHSLTQLLNFLFSSDFDVHFTVSKE